MSGLRAAGALLLLAGACGGGGEGGGGEAVPDVAGRYNVQVTGTSGCGGGPSAVADWAMGPLTVSGAGDDLVYDFDDGMAFPGSVRPDARATFAGAATWSGLSLEVSFEGAFSGAPGEWGLEGELTALVDDGDAQFGDACTLVALLEAVQLAR